MHQWFLTATFIVLASGCIPSTSVSTPTTTTTTAASTNVTTTTNSSNTTTTTTTTSSPNTTTTVTTTTSTASTTTTTAAPNCCSWPVKITGVNTVVPRAESWNQCNETITFTCALSSYEGFSTAAAVATTVQNTTAIVGSGLSTTVTIHCAATSLLWYVGASQSTVYSYFQCAYLRSNGEWYYP